MPSQSSQSRATGSQQQQQQQQSNLTHRNTASSRQDPGQNGERPLPEHRTASHWGFGGHHTGPPDAQHGSHWFPHFSTSGNHLLHHPHHEGTYVHPEYTKLNRHYGKPRKGPLWTLAKPLPRVVRPGMRRDNDIDGTQAVETHAKGGTEVAPQIGNTPGNPESQPQRESEPEQTQPTNEPEQSSADQGDSQRFTEDGRLRRPLASEVHFPPDEKDENGDPQQQPPEYHNWHEHQPGKPPVDHGPHGHGDHGDADVDEFLNAWAHIRHMFREPIAEWLGTAVTVCIGVCADLAAVTSGPTANTVPSPTWAWGFGCMLGIYISGGVSGGHLNPAISIALSVFRGFPTRNCIIYIIAQFLGALTGGGIALALYRDAILKFDNGVLNPLTTGVAMYTQPKSFISPATSFFNEYVGTAILACSVFALGDDTNAPPGAGMHSFIIGLLVVVICMSFGYNTSACLNPARDFGPRLAALMAGYGHTTFTAYHCWWLWGAWIATTSGAIAGGALYDIAIFIGGESPINYPKKRRYRAWLKLQARWWRRLGLLGFARDRQKAEDLEEKISEAE
ncbi:aquaporin [Xylona heveae TC161]|uniref:Aquaporin n=1 Tax=Xylona heveae (strain CBS 132557 / TC161) TaxID=1328760 RepID=A0A161TFA5_XYLHT|nr:aquaporin [Xylona heveae TC161]KZF24687.1 aquaporin [Xylona heveae TC161]